MEHAPPIGRTISWGQAVLGLAVVVVVVLGAWALLDGGTGSGQAATPSELRPRYAFSVLVLNGNGVSGAASALADRMLSVGYRETQAKNASVKTYAQSVVLYRPGWEAEAVRLAKDAHIKAIAPLDGPGGGSRFPLVAILGR